ncbi:ion channel [Microcoleus sp. FACHB-672]|uniref:ion channel n=1 Tax=Microcoleus sp. FACHB-672 TaxID=2692825 RepID=UPI001681D2BE|nr:ion channel [Microcoleus sp. FACHB-672]MBD2041516.1 ATP-sensitive inward rectifier potassium channel 10 [Microcoleus sp. FACHB-672]
MVKRHHPTPPLLGSRNSRLNVIRRGVLRSYRSDLYHFLVTLSWPGFLALITLSYVAANTLFALAYLAGGDCIENAQPGSFRDTFVFSVQTMATIGYGSMYPRTNYAHGLVALEALVGLLGFAMGTGIMFARFSLPTARVLFSRVAVIAPYDGVPTLMFRTANQRDNFILEAQVRVTLVRNEVTKEGHFMRRFYDLQLVRRETPIFALSWTVMHQIDETSPLYNATPESLAEAETELVITLTGTDESVSQTLHTRHAFLSSEILWNMRFVDILSRMPDGRRLVDYTHFHDVMPV